MNFELLFAKYNDSLYAYIYGFLNHKEMTEDVLQTTWEKAYRKKYTFVFQKSEKAWLFKIARNCAIDTLRKNKKIVFEEEQEIIYEENKQNEYNNIYKKINKLKQIDKEIIVLKFWSDMTTKEIAKTLKISETNVTTRLSRSLKQLEKELES